MCDQEWDLASQLALKLPENRIDVLPRNLLFWRQGPIKWDLELRQASEFTVVRRCSRFHDKKLDSKLVLALREKWDLACLTVSRRSRRARECLSKQPVDWVAFTRHCA